MNGDKEVSVIFIGNVGAFLKGDKNIRRAGIDHFDVGILLGNEFSHFEREGKVEVFLLGEASYRSGIFTSMPGVEHNGISLRRHEGKSHPKDPYE